MKAIKINMLDRWMNKVVCGDCLELMKELPDNCVDLVVTDPPYAISLLGVTHKRQAGKGSKRLDYFDGDSDWNNMIHNVVVPAIDISISKMTSIASIYIWCSHRSMGHIVSLLEDKHGFSTRPLIWLKKCTPPAPPNTGWSSGFELCVYGYRKGRIWNQKKAIMRNVFEADSYRYGQPGKVNHPTQKPLNIILPLIKASSNSNNLILDPFCGSGTTCVAAKQLGRRYIGMEISEEYCGIARKRLANTDISTKAERLEAGVPLTFEDIV